MALDRATAGLTFRLDADSKPAQADIANFKQFMADALGSIKDKAATIGQSMRESLGGIGKGAKEGATGVEEASKKIKDAESIARDFAQSIGSKLGESFGLGGGAANRFGTELSKLSGTAAIAGGVFVGVAAGVAGLTIAVAKQAGELRALSQLTGLNTDQVQQYQSAASIAGVGVNSLTEAIAKLRERAREAAQGNVEIEQSLQLIGTSSTAVARNSGAEFEKLLNVLQAVPDAQTRITIAQKILGEVNQDSLRGILALTDANGSLREELKRVGVALDQDTAQRMAQTDRQLAIFEERISNFSKKTAVGFLEVLQFMGDALAFDSEQTAHAGEIGKQFAAQQNQTASATSAATGTIQQQTAAVAALTRELASVRIAAIQKGISSELASIAFNAKDKASALVQLKQKLANDDDFFAGVSKSKQFDENLKALKEQITPKEKKTGGGGGAARAAVSSLRSETQDDLKALQLKEQAIQRAANADIFEAKRAFDARRITIEQLAQITIDAENRMFEAKKKVFDEERNLIEQAEKKELAVKGLKPGDRERIARQSALKIKEIDERQAAEDQKRKQAIEQAEDNSLKVRNQILEQASKARADRQEEELKQQIAFIRQAASDRIVTEENAAIKIAEIEERLFNRRKALLLVEIAFTKEGTLEQQRAKDELAKLLQGRVQSEEEAQRRISEARAKDLANLRAYTQERDKILESIQRGQVDELQRQASVKESRAQASPNAFTQQSAQQARAAADAAAAEFQHQQNLRQIEEQNSVAQGLADTSAQYLEIETLSHQQREQEEQRFQDEIQRIRQQADASPFQQIKDLLKDVAQGFVETTIAAIASGQSVGQAMKQMAAAVLAGIAKIAAAEAVKNLAYGLNALGYTIFTADPRGAFAASHYFASAALWGGLALGAAVGAGAIGKSSAPSAGGSGKDGASAQQINNQSQQRTIEQDTIRDRRPIVNITLHGEIRDGILQVVHRDIENNGRTSELIQRDARRVL